ncbi:META domain-containing protein [Thiofilum flexile]|uniref:META domain-containing protein n=1 Tax=Thiofilum flexile TaxID=125627 RepID=UPI0013A5B309|nr:META domain-containing protein [Thiofilum flexile]
MQHKYWRLVLVGCLLLTLNACNTKANPSSIHDPLLNQSQWVLAKNVPNLSRPITVLFERGRMSGFNGCNSYSGNYIANEDGTLALGQPSVSRILCSGVPSQTERDYMDKLARVRIYALVRGQLVLLDAQRKPLLTFQTYKPT